MLTLGGSSPIGGYETLIETSFCEHTILLNAMEPLNQILERVLQSPELRNTLENTIRNINNQRPQEQTQTNRRSSGELNLSSSVNMELHRLFPSIRGTNNPDLTTG